MFTFCRAFAEPFYPIFLVHLKKQCQCMGIKEMDLLELLGLGERVTESLTEGEREYLQHYLIQELGIREPITNALLLATQSAIALHEEPSAADIARELLNPPCQCLRVPPNQLTLESIEHILQVFRQCPFCPLIEEVYMYSSIEKRFPTLSELSDMMGNSSRLSHNPEQYCDEQRLLIPTPDIDKLTPFQSEEKDLVCSICQNPILPGTAAYSLPCGDCFHANACLDNDLSIVTWLQKCRRCPNCNQEVVLDIK